MFEISGSGTDWLGFGGIRRQVSWSLLRMQKWAQHFLFSFAMVFISSLLESQSCTGK